MSTDERELTVIQDLLRQLCHCIVFGNDFADRTRVDQKGFDLGYANINEVDWLFVAFEHAERVVGRKYSGERQLEALGLGMENVEVQLSFIFLNSLVSQTGSLRTFEGVRHFESDCFFLKHWAQFLPDLRSGPIQTGLEHDVFLVCFEVVPIFDWD